MKLDSIVIAVTNEYDADYRVERPPARALRMSLEQIGRLTDEAAQMGCREVILSGGEPFLIGDALERAVRHAAFKVPKVRVVTDCYWASTPHQAMVMLGRLYQSGLTELDIRFCDWNQEPKQQQWVKWATMAADKIGLTVFAHHLMDRTKQSLHVTHIKQYPSQAKQDFSEAIGAGALQSHVRPMSFPACGSLEGDGPSADELLFLQGVERGHCPYIFNSITAHPDGKLTACAGAACAVADDLNLGDWFTTPLAQLLEAGYRNPLLQWLRISGPAAIRQFVQINAPEIEFRQSYANLCHLCSDLLTRYETKRVVHEHAISEAEQAIAKKIEHLDALRALIAGAIKASSEPSQLPASI